MRERGGGGGEGGGGGGERTGVGEAVPDDETPERDREGAGRGELLVGLVDEEPDVGDVGSRVAFARDVEVVLLPPGTARKEKLD